VWAAAMVKKFLRSCCLKVIRTRPVLRKTLEQ